MNPDPSISIIIPCYNAEKWVAEAVDSVLQQTYAPLEIIVVDDGSTDDSLVVLRPFADRIRIDSSPNCGAAAARNRGLSLSTGKYVLFLDADDLIASDTLAALVDALQRADSNIAYCNWTHLIEKHRQWQAISYPHNHLLPPTGDYLSSWLTGWYIPVHAILWSREILDELGGWDETLHANDDGDFALRALIAGARVGRASGGTAYYRLHGASHVSVGSNSSLDAWRSRVRVLEKVECRLEEVGRLRDYAIPLGQAFHSLGRAIYSYDKMLAQTCWSHANRLAGKQAIAGNRIYRTLSRLLSVKRAARLSELSAKVGILSLRRRQAQKRLERAYVRRSTQVK